MSTEKIKNTLEALLNPDGDMNTSAFESRIDKIAAEQENNKTIKEAAEASFALGEALFEGFKSRLEKYAMKMPAVPTQQSPYDEEQNKSKLPEEGIAALATGNQETGGDSDIQIEGQNVTPEELAQNEAVVNKAVKALMNQGMTGDQIKANPETVKKACVLIYNSEMDKNAGDDILSKIAQTLGMGASPESVMPEHYDSAEKAKKEQEQYNLAQIRENLKAEGFDIPLEKLQKVLALSGKY